MATVRTRTLGAGAGARVGVQLISIPIADASVAVDQHCWIADSAYRVLSIEAIWSTVGGASAAVMPTKTTSNVADDSPAEGFTLITAAFDLTDTINVLNTGTLVATEADLLLADGDRLSLNFSGTVTGLEGLAITISVLPDPNVLRWIA